jgi:hypothetical protein
MALIYRLSNKVGFCCERLVSFPIGRCFRVEVICSYYQDCSFLCFDSRRCDVRGLDRDLLSFGSCVNVEHRTEAVTDVPVSSNRC